MLSKKVFYPLKLFLFVVLLFLTATPAFAVSVIVTNVPSSITESPFTVSVEVASASANTTNYLRINLYKSGTTDYFGYTFNGIDWYNGSTYTSYLPITIDNNGSWGGTVQGKLDTQSSYYEGPGDYNLKVRRYTASGRYIWSNESTLTVALPTPTPTIAPTSTPTSTPKPTATPKPTSQTSQSSSATSAPTSTPVPSSQSTTKASSVTSSVGDVLSASQSPDINLEVREATDASSVGEPKPTTTAIAGVSENRIPRFMLIGAGFAIFASGIIIAWKKYMSAKAPPIP